MNKLNRIVILVLVACMANCSFAQDTLQLTNSEFLAIVKNYHPLAFRYQLQNDIAKAEVLRARGNFDPMIDAKNGAKTIDGTNYYQHTNVGLGIPTWYGIELNGNYNYIDGQRLNNSDTRGGLYQFGVTLPLAKNFLYDARRATLDQAKFARSMTEAEQWLLTNELLLEADNAYWDWVMQYQVYLLQTKVVDINRERLALTRKSYEYGERAAIDTTEALSQLQSFEQQQQDALLHFIKATQVLQLYLWTENQKPYELNQMIFPAESIDSNSVYNNYPSLLDQLNTENLDNHLYLRYYFQKQNILESERRLKQQSFLPKLDFTYNFFNKENYQTEIYPLFQNNYQYGLKLEVPIFLRQARADYKIANFKIMQNRLDADYKRQELFTKIETYRNEVLIYRNQINIAERNIDNYQRLLNAEETKYSNGESSLFLINSRENKLIEAQEKMLSLRLKFIKGYNQLKWMNENINTGR